MREKKLANIFRMMQKMPNKLQVNTAIWNAVGKKARAML